MKDKNSQLVELMRGIRVSVPSDVADDIEKRIESYAATREAEGRIDENKRAIDCAEGKSKLVCSGQKEHAQRRIQALTDTQGEER